MTGRGNGNGERDRAVTVQIGAVILFGFLIVALSTYQATVVPDQNREVEFLHNQEVQTDMVELSSSITATGRTGDAAPATVKLGTRYPSRTFFVNPPPASGSLRTVPPDDNVNVSLENVTVLSSADRDEAADYWDLAESRNKSTRFVVYEPRYSNYREAPTTRYESGVAFNRFPNGANLTLTDQRVVEGDRITLIAVSGDLNRNGVSTVSVDPEAVSTVSRRERVSGELDVTIPTTLNATRWEELLVDEIDDGWVNGTRNAPGGVTIELNDSRTYSLGIAAVHVGSGDAPDRSPAYLDAEQRPSEMTAGTTREVVVEVRDEYGNPVPGTAVSGYASDGVFANGASTTVRTDDSGRAVFEYTAAGTEPTLNFSYAEDPADPTFDASSAENASVTVTVTGVPGGGGEGGLALVGTPTAFDGEDGDSVPGGVSLTVRNTRSTDVTIVSATVIPEDTRYNGLSDAATGEGQNRSELYVASDSESGYADVQTTGTQYTYVTGRGRSLSLVESRDERAYDTNTQSLVDVSTVVAGSGGVTVSSETNATVQFAEFYELTTNAASAVNMSDQDVRVIVSYTVDGEEQTDEFVVTPEPPEAAGGDGGGGGGSTAADVVTYNGDATTYSGGSGVEFSVSNTGTAPVTIDEVSVDVTGSSDLLKESDTGSGARNVEIYVASAGASGGYDAGDGPNDVYTLGSVVSLSPQPEIQQGDDGTFSLTVFRNDGSGRNDDPVDVRGEEVTVTVSFTDGSSETYTFTVP